MSPERLEEKLGWLREFEAEVAEWAEWQQVVNVTVEFVNRQGIYRGVAKQLRTELRPHRQYSSSRCLARELLAFVAKQARRTAGGTLSGEYGGVGIVLWAIQASGKATIAGWLHQPGTGVRSIAGRNRTTQAIAQAMRQSPTKAIFQWCADNLGTTLFGRRRQAFAASATKDG